MKKTAVLIILLLVLLAWWVIPGQADVETIGNVWVINVGSSVLHTLDNEPLAAWYHVYLGLPQGNDYCEAGTAQAKVDIQFWPAPVYVSGISEIAGSPCGDPDWQAIGLYAATIELVLSTGEQSLPPDPLGAMDWADLFDALEKEHNVFYDRLCTVDDTTWLIDCGTMFLPLVGDAGLRPDLCPNCVIVHPVPVTPASTYTPEPPPGQVG